MNEAQQEAAQALRKVFHSTYPDAETGWRELLTKAEAVVSVLDPETEDEPQITLQFLALDAKAMAERNLAELSEG
jgi:hypothetical protein